jgi:hypothetical protein
MSRRPHRSAVLGERGALPNWRIHRERQPTSDAVVNGLISTSYSAGTPTGGL